LHHEGKNIFFLFGSIDVVTLAILQLKQTGTYFILMLLRQEKHAKLISLQTKALLAISAGKLSNIYESFKQ
jgi:hypothetical protein